MMSFSCMKTVYEYTPYLYSRKNILLNPTFRFTTHKKASKPAKNTVKKHRRSNQIHCLAVMKLAHVLYFYCGNYIIELYAFDVCL